MKAFSELYDFYLNDVPGCSYKTAADAVRIAAQMFFERTRAWTTTLPPVVMVAGETEYGFTLPLDVELVRVQAATLDGIGYPLVRELEQGQRGIVVNGLRSFTLSPAPAAGQHVLFKVAIEPSNSATGIDDVMYSKYARIIAKCAKARLLSMDNQPFSNPERAKYLYAEFELDVDQVISDVNASYSNAARRVKAYFH